MAGEESHVSLSDASVPNAGRIYDYLLGGNHNFEVDRKAADQLKANFPEAVEDVRLIRWFLAAAVRRLSDEGYRKFLDFASGLPTVDHIHHVVHQGSKVVYSDIDPVTVSYGSEIVKDLEGVEYVFGDAGAPEKVVQLDAVRNLIAAGEKVAIGFSGISWFLPDEKIAHALEVLYGWAGHGSKLFLSAGSKKENTETSDKVLDFYKSVGQTTFTRTEETLKALFGKWQICDPGLLPLEKWTDVGPAFAQRGEMARAVTLVGAILSKE